MDPIKSKQHLPILEIAMINLKHNTFLSIIVSAAIIITAPIIFGIENLDKTASAVPLEMFISFIGIVLLTPTFQPEQSDEIADVIFSKYVSASTIYLIRTVYSFIFIIALTGLFSAYMWLQNCDMTFLLVIGTAANAVFLGSLGMLTSALTDNTVIAYMIPMVYYMLNYGAGSKLGNYYLFSMRVPDFSPKKWLLTTGILLIIISLIIKRLKRNMK